MSRLTLTLQPRAGTLELTARPCALRFDFAPVLRGAPGPAGGTVVSRTAASSISALRAVWESRTGTVALLDYRDTDHIDLLAGITVTAALTGGQDVSIQRLGVLDISGLGLSAGRVWLGVAGALTQTPPITGHDVTIGYATSSTRLYLSIAEPIILEH